MIKLVLSAVVVVAFSASSALAGSCPGGGCGGGDKDKSDKKKEGTTQTAVPSQVGL